MTRDKWAELGFELLLNPYETFSGDWDPMGSNFSTNGMSFLLRTAGHLLVVAPANYNADTSQQHFAGGEHYGAVGAR